jgi:hypothetical protein
MLLSLQTTKQVETMPRDGPDQCSQAANHLAFTLSKYWPCWLKFHGTFSRLTPYQLAGRTEEDHTR